MNKLYNNLMYQETLLKAKDAVLRIARMSSEEERVKLRKSWKRLRCGIKQLYMETPCECDLRGQELGEVKR